LKVGDAELADAMQEIARWRETLKTTYFYVQVADARSTESVRAPFERVTKLSLHDLAGLFARTGWRTNFGGGPWRDIALLTIDLDDALKAGDYSRANQICDEVANVRHNLDQLVPKSTSEQIVEKWPCLCDE
jgi:hypothetical protein